MINADNNPEFLNTFLDYTGTILNKSPNTIKEYNYDLNLFLKFILRRFKMADSKDDIHDISIHNMDKTTLNKITLDDIHAFLFYLANECNAKPATRARKVASIRVFFKYLAKQKIIDINPAQNLETPKIGRRMPRYLSLEDSKKLLNIAQNESDKNGRRDYAIITIFLNCGIRLSELVGMNISNINFAENRFTVIGKGDKERTIYLNKSCIKALKEYLEVRPKDGVKADSRDAVFLSERKERISRRTVQYIVKNELRKTGIDTTKYSVHKLRHTAATLMYQSGVDIRALQELLGHESISTTEIYTHVDNSQVRDAVSRNPLSDPDKL